jgi:hypothetical protein
MFSKVLEALENKNNNTSARHWTVRSHARGTSEALFIIIQHAADLGSLAERLLSMLIAAGADSEDDSEDVDTCLLLDMRDDAGMTPLLVVAQEGHAGIVRILMAAGADVDAALTGGPDAGMIPLRAAA